MQHDWYTRGLSLALLYDVAYHAMWPSERRTIRSALALVVLGKASWGTTATSTRKSPNCAAHSHRCYSNWAPYHANLYLTNLAIEGEIGFDSHTTREVALANATSGFKAGLGTSTSPTHFKHIPDACCQPRRLHVRRRLLVFHRVHEGSLGLVAAT